MDIGLDATKQQLVEMTGVDTLVIHRVNENDNWRYELTLGSAKWGDDLGTTDVNRARQLAIQKAKRDRSTPYYMAMKG